MKAVAPRIVALLVPLVAGCGNYEGYYPQKVERGEANIVPTNYRADSLAFLRTYLNDPTGIRDAQLAEPAIKQIGSVSRYAVCVRYNARRAGGGYEGARDRMIVFLAGKLDTMVEARRNECSDAKYQPFPELERLTR